MYVMAGCVWWDCGVAHLQIEDILNKGVILCIIRDIRGIKAGLSDVFSLKYVLNSSGLECFSGILAHFIQSRQRTP